MASSAMGLGDLDKIEVETVVAAALMKNGRKILPFDRLISYNQTGSDAVSARCG